MNVGSYWHCPVCKRRMKCFGMTSTCGKHKCYKCATDLVPVEGAV